MAEITGDFEVKAGEILGLDDEWTLLTEGGSITVQGGGTAKNITLSLHTFLTVDFDAENSLYSLADGVDLTQGILNLTGGNAYNVKWVPFESHGLICFLDSRSELTFSSDVSGVYNGREHWSKDGNYSELFDHEESLSGLTLETVYNQDESGYCDTVYVMSGGTLSDSNVISGNVQVYDGGIAKDIVLGASNDVGHISVFGGTLENITSICGEIDIGLSSSTVRNIVISSDEFCSTEMSICQDSVLDGLTVTSGSRLHVYTPDEFGGEIRNVTIDETGEAVFFSQTVSNLLMTGHAVVEVTGGVLTGSIIVTGSNPDAGYWCTLTDSTLDFDVSSRNPGEADPLVNNLSWIEMGSNVTFTLTVSAIQKNGIYKLASGAENFDQVIIIFNPASEASVTISVGETVTVCGQDYTLNLDDDLLSLAVSGGTPFAGGVVGDLNADGRADVIMTIDQGGHSADGATGAWLIQNDQTPAWGDLSTRNAGWTVFGTGKTAAGKNTDDVYIKSEGNIVGAWTTGDDGRVTGWETIGEFASDAQVLGLGDFNGNGQSDLLLRAANGAVGCYFTDGQGWNYFQSLGDEWKLSAIGDFNGDGRDDVVLKHDAGFAGCWLTQADGTPMWADLDTLPDGFEIVGAGDFNGDGTDDVLLKNGGYYGAWLVQNGNAVGWFGLGDLGDAAVEQIADFNGDGVDDLRVRTSAGDLGAQLVMGADTLDWHYYGSVGAEWNTSLAALS